MYLVGTTTLINQAHSVSLSQNWLLFIHRDHVPGGTGFERDDLYLLDVANGGYYLVTDTLLSDERGRVGEASWSPDGRWIYYHSWDKDGSRHLYRQSINTSASPQRVIENWYSSKSALPSAIEWTTDGQWIIHVRLYEGSSTLYRMRPDGSAVQRLTPPKTYFYGFSADQNWLYYVRSDALGRR